MPTLVTLLNCTGKFLSEALILASTNPQYDKKLFIDLPVQYLHENYKFWACLKCFHPGAHAANNDVKLFKKPQTYFFQL